MAALTKACGPRRAEDPEVQKITAVSGSMVKVPAYRGVILWAIRCECKRILVARVVTSAEDVHAQHILVPRLGLLQVTHAQHHLTGNSHTSRHIRLVAGNVTMAYPMTLARALFKATLSDTVLPSCGRVYYE